MRSFAGFVASAALVGTAAAAPVAPVFSWPDPEGQLLSLAQVSAQFLGTRLEREQQEPIEAPAVPAPPAAVAAAAAVPLPDSEAEAEREEAPEASSGASAVVEVPEGMDTRFETVGYEEESEVHEEQVEVEAEGARESEFVVGKLCTCEDGKQGTYVSLATPAPAPSPFPPPAPPAESSLNVTTTTVPPEAVTLLPPAARGWTANDTYEAQYGHKNITYPSPTVNGTQVIYPAYEPEPEEVQNPAVAAAVDRMVNPLNNSTSSSDSSTDSSTQPEPVSPLDHDLALDCVLGEWTDWGACGQHAGDGQRAATEERYRPIINPHHLGGMPCLPRVQRRPCGSDWTDGQYTGTAYNVNSRSGSAAMGPAGWVNGNWNPGRILSGSHSGNSSNGTAGGDGSDATLDSVVAAAAANGVTCTCS